MSQNQDHFHEEKAAKLLLKYYSFVFRQARRFLPVPDLVEDVVQQVFVEFLKKSGHFDLETDIRPLLTVITRRAAQRIWKEQSKMLPESLCRIVETLRGELTNQRYDTNFQARSIDDRIAALRACLRKLSESGRELIKHYYFDGISTEDLAEHLGKKSGTINKTIYRLREKLKDCIEMNLKSEISDA